MPITVRSFSKGGAAGNYSQAGALSIQRPFNLEANDVLVAFVAVTPRAFAQNQNEGRFYYPETPDGWRYVGSSTSVEAELYTFVRVASSSEPTDYTFTITQKIEGVPLDADPIKVLGGIIAYSGVSGTKTINALRTADFVGDSLRVVTTRQGCRVVLASLAVGADADVNADTYTEWIAVTDVADAHLQVADNVLSVAGEAPVETVTATGRVLRIMLALTPDNPALDEPIEVSPPAEGSGAGLYEREPTRALGLRSYRVLDGTFTEELEPIRPVAIDVTFNGIGACTGGSMQFVQNPQWRPYSRVLELTYSPRIDGVLYPNITYFVCVTGIPRQDVNPEKISQSVISLYQVVKGQPVFDDAYPRLPPVFDDTTILFAGVPPSRATGTKDEWQTWDEYLGKALASHPDCYYGVGRDYKYVQGRPQDGNFVVIDANSPDVTEVNPSEYVVNNYVTHYWQNPSNDTNPVTVGGVRPDLDLFIPRKTATMQTDGSGNPQVPQGTATPVYEIGSYTLKVKGLLIPPALITNLPNGIAQFVAGSRFVVAGGQAYTEIHTQALPRRST